MAGGKFDIGLRIESRGALFTGRGPTIVQANLDRFVTEATAFLLVEVQKRTPQGVYGAQGGLLGSIQHEVLGRGTPLIKGIVGSAHSYAEVVEKGRTAGKMMPPSGVLIRWLEVKLGLSEMEARRIEYVVRRKIGQKGFEGAHMFERAITENLSRLEQMARSCGLRIVTELGK